LSMRALKNCVGNEEEKGEKKRTKARVRSLSGEN